MRTTAIICAASAALVTAPGTAQAVTYKPVLTISKSSAPIREDVPLTITVTPAKKAAGKRVRLQVKGMVAWTGIDTFRLNDKGQAADDVEGYAPGVGRYRVLVLSKSGNVLAKSPVVSVSWTPREQT